MKTRSPTSGTYATERLNGSKNYLNSARLGLGYVMLCYVRERILI